MSCPGRVAGFSEVTLPFRPLSRVVFPALLVPSRRVLVTAVAAGYALLFPRLLAAQTPYPLPAYTDAPVFFELCADDYADSMNLALLREGKVRLIPLGVEDLGDFDWKKHTRSDLSWWMRVEDLQYLLSLINSRQAEDDRFAREWFDEWYEVHTRDPQPNPGAWQPMTAGIRALVLVRLLKRVYDSGDRDASLEMRLKESIIEHQQFLERDENFENRSNHGMWEALGLFETARVSGGAGVAAFALRRLAGIVEVSVSEAGIHKEHAAAYHFYFLRWLSDFVRYFKTLRIDTWSDIEALSAVSEKMHDAAYFLVDHGDNVPQIGDSDAIRIDTDSLGLSESARDRVLFDESGGIAVFKDPPDENFDRYIAFTIRQLRNLTLSLAHTHRDILAVYFSCGGEVILGDGGRFEYRDSVARRYFVSAAAHNMIVPMENLDSSARVTGPIGGIAPALEHKSGSVVFEGCLNRHLAIRRVTVPFDEPRFWVEDSISPGLDVAVLWNIGRDVVDVSEGGRVENDGEFVRSWVLTSAKGRRFELKLHIPAAEKEAVRVDVMSGQDSPMMGWYSPGYRRMVPVTVIQVTLRSPDGARIRMSIGER